MNATGESDTQNYHDNIRSFQQQRLRPVQERQIDWIGCDIWGWPVWQRKRQDLEISYPPLWSETAREKADRIAIYAGMVNALLTSGMIDPDAAIKELKAREVFATDIEAAEFLDQGPGLEGSPLDPENPLRELEGMQGGKKAGRMLRDPGASFKRGISMNAGEFVEGDHPRDGAGKFKDKGGDGGEQADEQPESTAEDGAKEEVGTTSQEEKQRKIDSIKIDFSRDNILPGLNRETLAELGKKDKPILLKKKIIKRNKRRHPEVARRDISEMIGYALYNPEIITPANENKPYFNFIARIRNHKSSVVLVELAETAKDYVIVHWHWVSDKSRDRLKRKGESLADNG